MKKGKYQVLVYHCTVILIACLLTGISSSCSDDMEREETQHQGEGKISLPIKLSFSPITETKAVTRSVKPGSELAKAGFHYELEVVSSTTADTLSAPDTKAVPTTLKNVVGLLFGETTGKYKGTATISGTVTAGSDQLLDFTVNNTTDTSYRLVVVANDNAAENPYTSTPALSSFTGTYTEFKDIKMTNSIAVDEDVPYVGSITGIKMEGASGTLVVPLYWSLTKITYKINNFSIKDGPELFRIVFNNFGYKYFGTPGEYDGTGSTATEASRAKASTALLVIPTFYCGENIRPNSSIISATDRYPANAANAACMVVETKSQTTTNTTPAVGEEYISSGGVTFKYYIYFGDGSVSDFSVRRNTKYTVTVNIDGTLEGQRRQAQTDKRIEVISNETHAGLNIGPFGGPSYTTGSSSVANVSGFYAKDLLLHPNTSGTTAEDTQARAWASTREDVEKRANKEKFWDPVYTNTNMEQGTTADEAILAYQYCYNLTTGGVAKGSWYLPTSEQLSAIWTVLPGLKNGNYSFYSGFAKDKYWSSTEYNENSGWADNFDDGNCTYFYYKDKQFRVRCVRDFGSVEAGAPQSVTMQAGYPVINLATLQPLGAVLSASEASSRAASFQSATVSNSDFINGSSEKSTVHGEWNAKMSPRFQVSKNDITSDTWQAAWNACKNYNGANDGGGSGKWRLPTERELRMIAILHPQLKDLGGFTAMTKGSYWSATESAKDQAYRQDFNLTIKVTDGKTAQCCVRCVRDL
ncbi:Lcl C-terminal domain-containing protein [Parabacteroides sp.]